jgi:siderophore synthetase component
VAQQTLPLAAAPHATLAWLAAVRPALAGAYRAALPGARAAVLARLWGALGREPLHGLVRRRRDGTDLVVALADGRRLRGPASAAVPFARPPAGFAVDLEGAGGAERFDDPARLVEALALADGYARFAVELDDSVANLALARAARPVRDGGRPALARLAAGNGDPVAAAEQLVVDGHPLHPCCRTRLGLSPAEVLDYAPEHRPVVTLAVVAVPATRWLTTGAGLPPRLPVHPWQRAHVLDRFPGLGPVVATMPARPLMSLRTVAPVARPGWHLKTAVDVQMTSAVRTVSGAAIHNGPTVSALLARLAGHTPGLRMLREVAAGAVLVDGEPCRSLAVVRREAPRPAAGEVVLPMAALAAPSPADGRPLAVEAVTMGYAGKPRAFFADLVHLMLPPLLTLLHLGVALEAHGQNTLVALDGGRPVRLLYRDVGGVRISPRRLARQGIAATPPRGGVASDDPRELWTKLAASILSTVAGELVSVLTREYDVSATVLWDEVARTARTVYKGLPAAAGEDAAALFGAELPVKAMTAMRLAARPTDDLWAYLPNPLAGLR